MSAASIQTKSVRWLMRVPALGVGTLLLAFATAAPAAELLIQASFRPDASRPGNNEFTNNTPPGDSYCGWAPQYCIGLYSIGIPITFQATADLLPGHDVRRGPMFQAPAYWRDVTVVNDATGESENLRFRVNGLSAAYSVRVPLTGGNWDWTWVNAPPPCQYGGVGYGNAFFYAWGWLVPEGAGICAKRVVIAVPLLHEFSYRSVGFNYALIAPKPLSMSAGVYRGQMTYTVGPYKDFDMGDVMLSDDDVIILNFELTVDHNLKVEVPPGGHRIQLEPKEGWQVWLQRGRKPGPLSRDQTVNLWTSTHFKMNLECAEPLGNSCSLRNAAGHQVPLDVAVSLPASITDAAGRLVSRLPLTLDGSGTELFQPSMYVDRKPSTLHFEVKADAVAQMLEQPGSTYSGSAAVVWDSEI